MLSYIRRFPPVLYSKPPPPPDRKDMFLIGFVVGFMVGFSHPWKKNFNYQSFF